MKKITALLLAGLLLTIAGCCNAYLKSIRPLLKFLLNGHITITSIDLKGSLETEFSF